MSNPFHNPSKARPTPEPKNSDRKTGKIPDLPNLKFKEAHKNSRDLLPVPKNIGGGVKEKHDALDVLG